MTSKTNTNSLNHNSYVLARAMEQDDHCRPGSVIVRDGSHSGTLFTWVGDSWIVYDLEGCNSLGRIDSIAVVTLEPDGTDDQAERGLNQTCIACDLEVKHGEWVVDAEDLPGLRDAYGDDLVVLWEQDGGDGE